MRESIGPITQVLRDSFGLRPLRIRRLPAGHTTVNYRAGCAQGEFFVKRYPDGADLAAEAAAIGMSDLAGRHGVPVATALPTVSGAPIATQPAVSVWHWVDAQPWTAGFSHAQQRAAGTALGRIHAAFADHPAGPGGTPDIEGWLALPKVTRDLDALLDLLAARAGKDEFDVLAEQDLRRRRAMLPRVPEIAAGLPELTTQVLHGDYSAVNLLFRGEELAAVLDFGPPAPFLIAYELGRIAFDPRVVVLTPDWPARARSLVEAYLAARPQTAAGDVVGCARMALLRLLTSLYGVRDHYVDPGPLQDDLNTFWLLRHRTAKTLLDQLDDIETGLARLAVGPARRSW